MIPPKVARYAAYSSFIALFIGIFVTVSILGFTLGKEDKVYNSPLAHHTKKPLVDPAVIRDGIVVEIISHPKKAGDLLIAKADPSYKITWCDDDSVQTIGISPNVIYIYLVKQADVDKTKRLTFYAAKDDFTIFRHVVDIKIEKGDEKRPDDDKEKPEPPKPEPNKDYVNPIHATVRIYTNSISCSATITEFQTKDGERYLFSAAHCGRIGTRFSVELAHLPNKYKFEAIVVSANNTNDGAILVSKGLAKAGFPIPYAKVARKLPNPGDKVFHAAWGGDKPGNVEEGWVEAITANQLQYKLNVYYGDSGGGIFLKETGEFLSSVCCGVRPGAFATIWGCRTEWFISQVEKLGNKTNLCKKFRDVLIERCVNEVVNRYKIVVLPEHLADIDEGSVRIWLNQVVDRFGNEIDTVIELYVNEKIDNHYEDWYALYHILREDDEELLRFIIGYIPRVIGLPLCCIGDKALLH